MKQNFLGKRRSRLRLEFNYIWLKKAFVRTPRTMNESSAHLAALCWTILNMKEGETHCMWHYMSSKSTLFNQLHRPASREKKAQRWLSFVWREELGSLQLTWLSVCWRMVTAYEPRSETQVCSSWNKIFCHFMTSWTFSYDNFKELFFHQGMLRKWVFFGS